MAPSAGLAAAVHDPSSDILTPHEKHDTDQFGHVTQTTVPDNDDYGEPPSTYVTSSKHTDYTAADVPGEASRLQHGSGDFEGIVLSPDEDEERSENEEEDEEGDDEEIEDDEEAEYEEEDGDGEADGEEDQNETQDAAAHLRPYNLSMIDLQVYVQPVAGKGRCLFARHNMNPGDIIFVEAPVLAAVPSVNAGLWQVLQELNSEEAFNLPPVWHLAAITSLTKLELPGQRAIQQKFVPDPNEEPGRDVRRVLDRTGLALDAHKYQRALNAWRFNGFGHHAENEGLILYDRISNMAHSCNASATWHYGSNEAFVLRARTHLSAGAEITISYIGDDDLLKPTHIRREKLQSWQFTCRCDRCEDPVDRCRGFRCPDCGAGTVFMKTDTYLNADGEEECSTTAQPCTVCTLAFSSEQIAHYESFEDAYIARVEECSKKYLADLELVYQEAGRVFTQHSVMFDLDTMLYEAYKDQGNYTQAAWHLQKRIDYAFAVLPRASFTVSGMYEDLGDILTYAAGDLTNLNGFYRNAIARAFETAFNSLILLCGADHEYTLAAHAKFAQIVNTPPAES